MSDRDEAKLIALRREVGQLLVENKFLREHVTAATERHALELSKRTTIGGNLPVARLSILGRSRRKVEPGEPLFLDEIVGLEEGKHYELVPVEFVDWSWRRYVAEYR